MIDRLPRVSVANQGLQLFEWYFLRKRELTIVLMFLDCFPLFLPTDARAQFKVIVVRNPSLFSSTVLVGLQRQYPRAMSTHHVSLFDLRSLWLNHHWRVVLQSNQLVQGSQCGTIEAHVFMAVPHHCGTCCPAGIIHKYCYDDTFQKALLAEYLQYFNRAHVTFS